MKSYLTQSLFIVAFSLTVIKCDFVEDPGTVEELNPDVYSKDIYEGEQNKEVLSNIERFMSDLQLTDMLTVELAPGEEQTFYVYVDQAPSKIKIAFSITSEDATAIDFKFFVGKDQEILSKKQEKESYIDFNVHSSKQFQRYGITFTNSRSSSYKDVTFAFKLVKKSANDGQTPADAAPTEDEAALFSYLEQSNADMGHFMTENKFQNFRMHGYVKTAQNATTESMGLTVFEILIMIGLGVYQVYYLKKVLDNKRMI